MVFLFRGEGFIKHMFGKNAMEMMHVYKYKRNKVSLSSDNHA